jgi:O-antigen ligase
VRAGVRLTTSGRGQLQGGLFAFPAALLISMAALMSHQIRSLRARLLLAAVAVLNVICLVLTYERTFWIATTIGAAYVVVKFGASERLRAFVWGTVAVVISFGLLATFAPSDLSAARERLLSLSQYGTDASVKYRTAESSNVLRQIKAHPVIGSGLGASIFWGQPWDLEPPARETFAHNGYLWLAWKLGIPAAAILYLLLAMSLGLFIRSRRGALFEAVQKGARASLLILAIGSVTLPAYNQLSITAALGVLMAISLAPAQLAAPPRLARAQAAGERQG